MEATEASSLLPFPVRLGRWWFQWRSFSPVPLFMALVILRPDFQPTPVVYLAATIGILFAEWMRIWAVGYAGSRTRTRGDTVEELVHMGPYRLVRNPLYLANILMYTLCGVLFGFIYLSVFIFLYSAIQYHFIVAYEEDLLERTFGDAYHAYVSWVPRWIPALTPQIGISLQEFDLQRALRSERSTFYSMATMAVLCLLKTVFLKH